MIKWTDVMAAKARHDELLKELEKMRLLQRAIKSQNPRRRIHRQLLAWLGERLVAWGLSLQEHYGQRGTQFRNQPLDVG